MLQSQVLFAQRVEVEDGEASEKRLALSIHPFNTLKETEDKWRTRLLS